MSDLALVTAESILHNVGDEDMRATGQKVEQQRLGGGQAKAETEGQDGASSSAKAGATASQVKEIKRGRQQPPESDVSSIEQ